MNPVLAYTEFKRKLCANPKWIARGLTILEGESSLGILRWSIDDHFALSIMVRRIVADADDGGLPWALDSETGIKAVGFVRQNAPAIYTFYREKINDYDKSLHS